MFSRCLLQSYWCKIKALISKSLIWAVMDENCLRKVYTPILLKKKLTLFQRPNVRLRALQIQYHYSVAKFFSDRVMDLITSQQYLEELELSCEVGDLLLGAICSSLLSLKDLKLLYCCAVVRGAGFIFSLKNLTSLQMMECYQVISCF